MTKTLIRVDIVSDVVCPWCVIGYHQLAQAARDTGTELDVHWHPFELNSNMAINGENLREHLAAKYGTTMEGSIKARARLTKMGSDLGFTFNYSDDMRMYNTFAAHQVVDWAEEHGKGHEMKMALFGAFFTDSKDVSDIQVLADIATIIGLDGAQALAILSQGERAPMVREKQRYWSAKGVQGVPAMVFEDSYLVTGAQGEANYENILTQLSKEKVV